MKNKISNIYRRTNCPVPNGEKNHHEGLDSLFQLMGTHGFNLYRTEQNVDIGGSDGVIDASDIVLIKVNAQWKYRGCTNSDVIRGLIQRILEHPDGFEGEIVIVENGQGKGSLNCDTMTSGRYPDTGIHANAEDENHSFAYLVNTIFNDPRVSMYLLDPIHETFIAENDHTTDGYRKFAHVSYPCFTTARGTRVELREGVWNGTTYEDNLKLISIPVFKHHGGCGITGALKHCYGLLSMADGQYGDRHYEKIGQHCGEMATIVRTPVIHILDCIWVTHAGLEGYPPENTTRLDQLLASVDPVALDYWASKYVLYPIDNNVEHHPDRFVGLRECLLQARDVINANGGVMGHTVTVDESHINVIGRE